MNKYAREILINNFIEKLDELIIAANAIEDFKFDFKIGITSDNAIRGERERTIKFIDDIWDKHGYEHY